MPALEAQVSAGRPAYHFVAPRGWMNDPCAPGYDPTTGLYHLFYQWSPHTHRWDRIAWGHATSRDLMHWTHSSPDTPVLAPDKPYDREGVFTGCFWPSGPRGQEDQLCVFYTNVDSLPLHWTIPYTRGCEGLAMAISRDRGKTWDKWDGNPVLKEEPADLNVSGFRDPFLAPWPAMDAARRKAGGQLYGLISGGIKGVGPRTFLYEVDPTDLTKWTYLHPLLCHPENHMPAGRWGGDLGINLECTNFLTLTSDDGLERQVIATGTEGGKAQAGRSGSDASCPERVPRYGPWLMGNLEQTKEDGQIDLALTASGMVDWAELYAYNTFKHTDGRTLLWGWLIEEDLTDAALEAKSWTGCMGVPREVFLATYHGVKGTLVSTIEDVRSFEVVSKESDGTHSVATLGIRPLRELEGLRGEQLHQSEDFDGDHLLVASTAPLACKLEATVLITPETEEVTLCIRHSDDHSTATRITFYPGRETLIVHRGASNADLKINKDDEEGAFTLLRTVGGLEPLRLQVFLDHDTIEVFANDRFSLSTRVYSPKTATGISYSSRGGARVESLSLWEMAATQ